MNIIESRHVASPQRKVRTDEEESRFYAHLVAHRGRHHRNIGGDRDDGDHDQ